MPGGDIDASVAMMELDFKMTDAGFSAEDYYKGPPYEGKVATWKWVSNTSIATM